MLTKLARLCLPAMLCNLFLAGCVSTGSWFGNTETEGKTPTTAATAPGQPHQIALLLPMEGDLAGAAKVIQDGFNSTYTNVSNKPTIKIYDTAQGTPISTLYANAVSDGADLIVGPLEKSNVAALQTQGNLTVTTIALNQLDNNIVTPNLYQFALSPTDEAHQVADRASQDGHHNALLITPAGPWGAGIATALQTRWQQDGGTVVDSLAATNNPNLTNQIKQLLQVQGTTHRQDVDVIFLIAQPTLARQIKPLLKFYYADDLPVYSDSLVYTGLPNATADQDLNDIEFCDMPLVLSSDTQWEQIRQQVLTTWPNNQQQYIRLYGFGADAALLTMHLNQLSASPDNGLSGATGMLYKDDQQHILRKLNWAQFQGGLATNIS